jgi:hypothetical protein
MPLSRAARLFIVGFSLTVLVLSSALPVSADAASKWKVGYYTPSTPGTLSMSAAGQGGIASLGFTNLPNTALPANVRFYFATDNGGGFAFTHYWWSNPAPQVLSNGSFTLTANVEPAESSDWNGQVGTSVAAGFNDAAANVTLIGLSFGGGCFFENGVGTTDRNGTFTLQTFTAS